MKHTPRNVGHRGSRDHVPENTLLALRAGAKAGAVILESDIQVAADGVVVMCHDIDTNRCFNKNVVVEETPYFGGLDQLRTLGEYQEPMPTLAQVLDALLHDDDFAGVKLMIDVKRSNSPNVAGPLRKTLETAASLEKLKDRIILGVWRPTVLEAISAKIPELDVCFIGWRICDAYKFLSNPQVTAISLNHSSYIAPGGRKLMDAALDSNRQLFTWTVNNELQMKWALAAKLDGVITDFPAKFAAVVKGCTESDLDLPDASKFYTWRQTLRLWFMYYSAWLVVGFADQFPSLARGR